MARKRITARDALRMAYAAFAMHDRDRTDGIARETAVAAMVADGWDADIAEAAVIAAFNAHFAIAGAV